MMMIKTVFFDFDGVLTTDFNGTTTIARNLSEKTQGLTEEKILACYRKHCKRLVLGGKHTDVWEDFCSCVGQNIPIDLLLEALRRVPLNEAMFQLVQSLRTRYRIGMITDNFGERMDLLKTDLLKDFDPIIVSANVHASKNDGTTKIFDLALEAANCRADESVFIDNQQHNLITAEKMGIKTYFHDDVKNDVPALVAALRAWGVIVEDRKS